MMMLSRGTAKPRGKGEEGAQGVREATQQDIDWLTH